MNLKANTHMALSDMALNLYAPGLRDVMLKQTENYLKENTTLGQVQGHLVTQEDLDRRMRDGISVFNAKDDPNMVFVDLSKSKAGDIIYTGDDGKTHVFDKDSPVAAEIRDAIPKLNDPELAKEFSITMKDRANYYIKEQKRIEAIRRQFEQKQTVYKSTVSEKYRALREDVQDAEAYELANIPIGTSPSERMKLEQEILNKYAAKIAELDKEEEREQQIDSGDIIDGFTRESLEAYSKRVDESLKSLYKDCEVNDLQGLNNMTQEQWIKYIRKHKRELPDAEIAVEEERPGRIPPPQKSKQGGINGFIETAHNYIEWIQAYVDLWMENLQGWIVAGKLIISNAKQQSIRFINDKIEWLMDKIGFAFQKVKEWIQAAVNQINKWIDTVYNNLQKIFKRFSAKKLLAIVNKTIWKGRFNITNEMVDKAAEALPNLPVPKPECPMPPLDEPINMVKSMLNQYATMIAQPATQVIDTAEGFVQQGVGIAEGIMGAASQVNLTSMTDSAATQLEAGVRGYAQKQKDKTLNKIKDKTINKLKK